MQTYVILKSNKSKGCHEYCQSKYPQYYSMGNLTSQTMSPKHWTHSFQVSCVAMCSMLNLTLFAVRSTPFLATANILLAVRREDASGTGSGDLGQRTPGGTSKWRSKTKKVYFFAPKRESSTRIFLSSVLFSCFLVHSPSLRPHRHGGGTNKRLRDFPSSHFPPFVTQTSTQLFLTKLQKSDRKRVR